MNLGKKILLAGTSILLVYGAILAAIGLFIENLSLTWWLARLTIFFTIFSTTLLLSLYYLQAQK